MNATYSILQSYLLQEFQWFQSLFRCRIELLNFVMGFNIIAPYMEMLHINRSLHHWFLLTAGVIKHVVFHLNRCLFPAQAGWAFRCSWLKIVDISINLSSSAASYCLSHDISKLIYWHNYLRSWCALSLPLSIDIMDLTFCLLHLVHFSVISIPVHVYILWSIL